MTAEPPIPPSQPAEPVHPVQPAHPVLRGWPWADEPPPPPSRRWRRRLVVGGVTAAAVVLVALGVGESLGVVHSADAPCHDRAIQHRLADADVPDGFVRTTVDHGRFSVAAPRAFTVFELSRRNIDAAGAADPDSVRARVAAHAQVLVDNHAELLLADEQTGGTVSLVPTSLVTHCALPVGTEQESRHEVQALRGKVLSITHVNIGGRESMETRYTFRAASGIPVFGAQAYIPGKDALYLLTVTSNTLIPQDVEEIIESVRVP